MDADEGDIFRYLKTWGLQFINAKEICRRAGGRKRYHDDPDWAKHILPRMVERGILEGDIMGRYRIKPVSRKAMLKKRAEEEAAQTLAEKSLAAEAGDSGAGPAPDTDEEIGPDEYYDEL